MFPLNNQDVFQDGGLCAAKLLESGCEFEPCLSPASFHGRRCLELGSGCGGCAGLACICLGLFSRILMDNSSMNYERIAGSAEVVLTDVASIVPVLQRNVDAFIKAASKQVTKPLW
jgi:hypothetical protein